MVRPYKGLLLSLKKGGSPEHTTMWMNLENILLSETSQPQEATECVIPFLWNTQSRNSIMTDQWLPGVAGGEALENEEGLYTWMGYLSWVIETSQNWRWSVHNFAAVLKHTELYFSKSDFVVCDYISKNVTLESLRRGETSTNCVCAYNIYTKWASAISYRPFDLVTYILDPVSS